MKLTALGIDLTGPAIQIMFWNVSLIVLAAVIKLLTPTGQPQILKETGTSKPEIEKVDIAPKQGGVRIGFKYATSSGVTIYSRYKDEKEFTVLATAMQSPFADGRLNKDQTKPETRFYVAKGLDGNNPIGVLSDVLQVEVAP